MTIKFLKNIKDGYVELEKGKRSDPNEKLKGRHKSQDQKCSIKDIKMLYESREKLSMCLMIILQWYLRLNTNQFMEKDLKY